MIIKLTHGSSSFMQSTVNTQSIQLLLSVLVDALLLFLGIIISLILFRQRQTKRAGIKSRIHVSL